jgi:hypothetical protein
MEGSIYSEERLSSRRMGKITNEGFCKLNFLCGVVLDWLYEEKKIRPCSILGVQEIQVELLRQY